nr:hypothetical protein HmN_000917300 [Hymenolepis microstoma]
MLERSTDLNWSRQLVGVELNCGRQRRKRRRRRRRRRSSNRSGVHVKNVREKKECGGERRQPSGVPRCPPPRSSH